MRKFLKKNEKSIRIIIASIFGAIFTYSLYTYLGFNNVVAASVAGVLAGLVFSSYAAPIYMGAFVGMVSGDVIMNFWFLFLASLVAGIFFIYSEKYFKGLGGKLGGIAFISILLTLVFVQFFKINLFISDHSYVYDIWAILIFIFTGVVFAYVTDKASDKILILIRLKTGSRVLGSALIGLLAGLIIPVLFSFYGLLGFGLQVAMVALIASFVGMTSSNVFKMDWEYPVAGGIAGLVYALSGPLFPGFGGKAGSIAFVAVIIFVKILGLIKYKQKN